jgi:H+-translocating NAD(P) transhydrogenase subunit beta
MPQASVGCVCFSTRRALLAALVGSGAGFSCMSGGVVLYLSSSVWTNTERIALYGAVFAGALVFAASAIALCKLRGALSMKVTACPGQGIVNLSAMLLCAWLGYGFVTTQVQPFGLAALLATGALASAMGVHLTTRRAHCVCGHDVLANDKRGITERIEWREGEEPAWVLREITPGGVCTASCRYRRARHQRNSGRNTVGRSRVRAQ